MPVDLSWDDRQRLVELLRDQRDDTASGQRSGYSQDRDTELAEIDILLSRLED